MAGGGGVWTRWHRYAESSHLLCTSLQDTFEAFVLLEALVSQKFVVCTRFLCCKHVYTSDAGFIMECLTDNRTRATTEIWTIVKKLDGKVNFFFISHRAR